jgi:hypothetical protein
LSNDTSLKGIFDNLNVFVTSGNFVRIEGGYGADFTGYNLLSSNLRER